MALTAHTSTVKGTQTRGSAVGTQRRWLPPNDVVIAAGVESIVCELYLPDALSLFLDWQIKAASVDGIERVRVMVSQDGLSFEEVWSKTYDPDIAPNNPDSIHNFAAILGWSFAYLQILMTSKTAGGGSTVNTSVTESIFTGGFMQIYEPVGMEATDPAALNERLKQVYAEGEIFDAALSGVEQAGSELVIATSARSFNLELGLKLTSWTSLATITIRPQVYFNGQWWDLITSVYTAGKQTVTAGFVIELATTGDLDVNIGVGQDTKLVGERIKLFVTGNVADGEVSIYAIAKVPY